jgi:serine/threonine-protein kinase RsbT
MVRARGLACPQGRQQILGQRHCYAIGGRGRLRVEQLHAGARRGVRATFTDEGPGIEDIEAALTDGFSTGASLGLGLPGSRRLVDELLISSAPGSGTTMVIVKWRL